MLKIVVPGNELFDNEKQEFLTEGDVELELEHSLVSLSKWESIWEKPFLDKKDKTSEEALSYIKCMCITPDVPPEVFSRLSKSNLEAINAYINAKMTATWFSEEPKKLSSSEMITAELIYYWMVTFNIPKECETWHLNRLFTVIRVANVKNSPKKKVGRAEMAAQRRAINERNKQLLGTKG